MQSETFNKTLISVGNLKIETVKEPIPTSHFYRPIRLVTFMLTNLKFQVFLTPVKHAFKQIITVTSG